MLESAEYAPRAGTMEDSVVEVQARRAVSSSGTADSNDLSTFALFDIFCLIGSTAAEPSCLELSIMLRDRNDLRASVSAALRTVLDSSGPPGLLLEPSGRG